MKSNYSKLFQTIDIGGMTVKNRLVVPPMETGFAGADGGVSQRMIDYYSARAGGGFGLIIVEITAIEPHGKGFEHQLCIYDDKYIPGFKDLVDSVHEKGAKIALQLYHPGRCANPAYNGNSQPMGPSALADPVFRNFNPREMGKDDIENLVDAFAQGARRAKQAGFDAVEIHGAHGYLVCQFMSAYANKRTDEYGGNRDGFLRLPLAIVRRVRQLVGRDFPLSFRLSAYEGVPQGRTVEESCVFAQRLVGVGVDAIHVSAGVFESYFLQGVPPAVEQGFNAPAAAAIKLAVSVPVIVVGRINDPDIAEKIISSGKADLVSMGRQSITDPEWPNKVMQDEIDAIVKCLSCNDGCVDGLSKNGFISCVQNPRVGREREYVQVTTKPPKRVLIAGGGPAGLEAARTAAWWGHKVSLYEKGLVLGGQVLLAAIPPTKAVWADVANSRIKDMKRMGVEIILGKEVDASLVKKISPDVLIITTGSEQVTLKIPGIDREKVISAQQALIHPLEGNKVVVIGGGLVGCETADFLAQQGKDVTVVEMLPRIARDLSPTSRYYLLRRLKENKVNILISTTVRAIDENSVLIDSPQGQQTISPVDIIVLAAGARSLNSLEAEVKGLVPEIYCIGDASCPGKVLAATQQAAEICRHL